MWCKGDVRLGVSVQNVYPAGIPYALKPKPTEPAWTHARLGETHAGGDPLPVHSLWNRLGFFTYEHGLTTSFSDSTAHGVALPAWLPVTAFAVPPLLWL